jgi:hypothetical protein
MMFTGKSEDGTDMEEVNTPFFPTKEDRMYWEIRDHIDGKRSLQDEYDLVKAKKSTLSRALRDFLVKFMNEG